MMKMADLVPHPEGASQKSIGVSIHAGAAFEEGALDLSFELRALPGASIPDAFKVLPALTNLRVAELWKEICFEAFLSVQGKDAYFEFNGALNGNWDLYAFDSYRSGMRRVPSEVDASPRLSFRESGESVFRIAFRLPEDILLGQGALGSIGLTTVLKTENGTSYWALNHGGMKPDFHLRSSFIYDPIRN